MAQTTSFRPNKERLIKMNTYLFAQVATPAATTTTQAAPTTDAAPKAPQQQNGFGMFVPMLIIFALFYFMMIRPQQRKEKERRKMINELRAGAKIMFAGGLLGTIAEAREKTFMVEIANGVRIEISRACVQDVVVEEQPQAK
jgi:preprotein translocase subunit YajC